MGGFSTESAGILRLWAGTLYESTWERDIDKYSPDPILLVGE